MLPYVGSIPFIFIIILIHLVYISYSHHQIYILIHFVSLLILLFASLIQLFDIYFISFFVSIVYSGAIIIIFLFVITIFDQTEISISDNYKFLPLLLFLIVQAYLLNLLWPLMNQLNKNGKMSILDIDTLFSDFIFIDFHKIGIYPGGIEMLNRFINVSNLKSNENDIQGIANILYNDMNVFLLIVGFTLFISLILLISNIFYSFVFKKRNRLSNVDIYNLLENSYISIHDNDICFNNNPWSYSRLIWFITIYCWWYKVIDQPYNSSSKIELYNVHNITYSFFLFFFIIMINHTLLLESRSWLFIRS